MSIYRIVPPQKRIVNQKLITDLNDLFMRIKIHLFNVHKKTRDDFEKPTVEEIDEIHAKIDQILSMDQESYKKY